MPMLHTLQARHIGKVVVHAPASHPLASGGERGSVVISGGLGSLGALVAAWICCKCTANVNLLGRTGHVSPSSKNAMLMLAGRSQALIRVAMCDAAQLEDVAAATEAQQQNGHHDHAMQVNSWQLAHAPQSPLRKATFVCSQDETNHVVHLQGAHTMHHTVLCVRHMPFNRC